MLSLHSPAKLNLFLRILRKRADGFHELASLFQAISLCDTLEFTLAREDRLTCTDPTLPTDASNLVNRAIGLFRRKSGLAVCLAVHLHKHIPMEAGLGGGSSNAATTLWACNELTGRRFAASDLMSWGAEIGSDVAFFLSEGTAYCTGRGESIRPEAPRVLSQPLWVVKPQDGLSTKLVYGALDPSILQPRNPDEDQSYYNDLEGPAFALMPSLAKLRDSLLQQRFAPVLMSGSGTSFFCVGEPRPIVEPGTRVYQASFLNRSGDRWYTLPQGEGNSYS